MAEILTSQGQMLDALARDTYGTEHGTTEAVLTANPGLAALGPILPQAYGVILPPMAQVTPAPAPQITLWS